MDNILAFCKQEDFDILHFQEVTGGVMSFTDPDLFGKIKQELGLSGELVKSWVVKGDEKSYFGNATLYKPPLSLLQKEVVRLKPFAEIENPESMNYADEPQTALALLFEYNGKQFWSINTHLAWSNRPTDEPHKLVQGRILYDFVSMIDKPFILSGDFNVIPASDIVKWFDRIARNITVENHVINTLNPRKHKAPHLFPPGLCVDFAYVTKEVSVQKFEVLSDLDLSDHLGTIVEFDIN